MARLHVLPEITNSAAKLRFSERLAKSFRSFFYSKKLSFMILDKYIGLVALVDDVISRLFANFALKLC